MALDALIGFGGMLGLRDEATWGTSAGNSDHWLGITSVTPRTDIGMTVLPYLGSAADQSSHVERDSVSVRHDADLDVAGCASYDDKAFLLLLLDLFGTVSTSGPVSTKYTHDFTFSIDGRNGKGLSAQVVHGLGLSSPAELFVGCRVSRMELEVVAGGWMTWKAMLLARTAGGMGATAGTPAVLATEEVLAHQGASMAWNSRTLALRRLKVTIDKALIRRPVIGSLYTDKQIPGGPCVITVGLERSWEDNNLYSDYLAAAQDDASIVFTGTGDNTMTLDLQRLKWFSVDEPVDRQGELTQRAVGRCFADATFLGASISVTNANSSAT